MAGKTTINEFRGRLLCDTFDRSLDDHDAFLLFCLFHYYQIELADVVLTDRPSLAAGDRLVADTQRGCGEALAALWRGSGDERSDYMHWYWRWNTDWGADGHAENLSDQQRNRLRELMRKLEAHPFVQCFVPEDQGLLGESESHS